MKLPVLSVADGAAWEERLVAALTRGPHGVEIARRCVDVVDLLAVASSGQGRAALLAPSLRRLDTDAIDRLVVSGVVPVAVVPRGDESAAERMRALGVEHLVPDDADPGVVAAVIAEAVRAAAAPDSLGGHANRAFADPAMAVQMSMPVPPGAGSPLPAGETGKRGTVIAVWGPTGAPGRTTVAVTLADEIARFGPSALLVDADVYGGTVAAVLGLLDESPGVAAACRQASAKRLDAAALARRQLATRAAPTGADRRPPRLALAGTAALGAERRARRGPDAGRLHRRRLRILSRDRRGPHLRHHRAAP